VLRLSDRHVLPHGGLPPIFLHPPLTVAGICPSFNRVNAIFLLGFPSLCFHLYFFEFRILCFTFPGVGGYLVLVFPFLFLFIIYCCFDIYTHNSLPPKPPRRNFRPVTQPKEWTPPHPPTSNPPQRARKNSGPIGTKLYAPLTSVAPERLRSRERLPLSLKSACRADTSNSHSNPILLEYYQSLRPLDIVQRFL